MNIDEQLLLPFSASIATNQAAAAAVVVAVISFYCQFGMQYSLRIPFTTNITIIIDESKLIMHILQTSCPGNKTLHQHHNTKCLPSTLCMGKELPRLIRDNMMGTPYKGFLQIKGTHKGIMVIDFILLP